MMSIKITFIEKKRGETSAKQVEVHYKTNESVMKFISYIKVVERKHIVNPFGTLQRVFNPSSTFLKSCEM